MPFLLLAENSTSSAGQLLLQQCLNGLTFGSLIALIALGYTMVYGIIGLINFAHGDLFMLGAFVAFSVFAGCLPAFESWGLGALTAAWLTVVLATVASAAFCGVLNLAVDRIVYKPLRNAPKLAPLVSAIGVSFVFMNVGQLWRGALDVSVPTVFPGDNLVARWPWLFEQTGLRFTWADLIVMALVIPIMIALTVFVKYTRMGNAMRATAQNPVAAQLMGINVERVIGVTFVIGGALGGVASVISNLYVGTVNFQMGFQNGLYAFTAAVLGGIGNIPGAVLGGLLIGFVKALSDGYGQTQWTNALIFAILIVILIFRPRGLLGATTREKV